MKRRLPIKRSLRRSIPLGKKQASKKNQAFGKTQSGARSRTVWGNQTVESDQAAARNQAFSTDLSAGPFVSLSAFLSLCFFLLLWTGCQSPAAVLTQRTDSVYIDKLIPYALPADSASVRALVRCDENGQIALRGLEMANTKNVQLLFTIDSLGEVIAHVKVKRDTLYLPSKETIVVRETDRPVPVAPPLSRWEKLKRKVGGWVFGSVTAAVILALAYAALRRIIRKRLGLL